MSNLIETTFNNLIKNKKKALIPFITANYPNRVEFLRLLHKLPDYGATMVEIGIPFSDPMADGIVIQKTSEQAIKNGFTIIQLIKDIS